MLLSHICVHTAVAAAAHMHAQRTSPEAQLVGGAFLQIQKKKIWEELQPDLKTDGDRLATWQGHSMQTSAGAVTADSVAGGGIS